jgi:hypothetical protein
MPNNSLIEKIKEMNIEAPPPKISENYSPIPVVHELARLYSVLHNAIRDFPRLEKFSQGEMMEKILLECIEACFLGTTLPPGSHKLHYVATASAKFDALKVFIRISLDSKILKDETYTKLIPILATIGKNLGGWLRTTRAGFGKSKS